MPPTTTLWASEEGCAGLGLSRRAALFQARRGQPALRRRLSRLWRAARRVDAGLRAADLRCLHPRRAGARHPVQSRLQRRAAGRRRLLPAHAARRAPLLGRRSPISTRSRRARTSPSHRRRGARGSSSERAAPSASSSPASGGQRGDPGASARCIVAAGAIGSPKLLLQSGIGPADHLRRSASRSCTTCPASAATCRIISTSSSSAECTGDHTYDKYRQARTGRVWAGLQYLLFRNGPGRLEPLRDRRLLVCRPGRALARHPVPSRARLRHRGRRRAS